MLGLNSFNQVLSDEFNFNISELQITESGNLIKGVNGGIVTTKNNEIIIECVDSPKKINEFLKSVKKIAVKIVRSGSVGINSN